jgi:hypothetical protein
VKLSLGGSIHDPTDPVGRLLFNVLAMVAEFETDLIRMRTREGMKVAKANGRLRGKQPKLKPNQAKHLLELHDLGTYTQAELAELFGVDGPPSTAPWSGCGLRRRNPSDPSHALRTLRRRAEPDIIPINSPKISAASTRPTRPGLRSVDERQPVSKSGW